MSDCYTNGVSQTNCLNEKNFSFLERVASSIEKFHIVLMIDKGLYHGPCENIFSPSGELSYLYLMLTGSCSSKPIVWV